MAQEALIELLITQHSLAGIGQYLKETPAVIQGFSLEAMDG